SPLFLTIYVALIVFFAFFYTAIVFNPQDTAENLRKHGGFIPGIRPGQRTAEYLDYVLTRLTTVGAIYLAAVCVLPEILISQYAVPFYFGGTSLLIVVSVTMDTTAQIQSPLIAHHAEGLIRQSRLRGARRSCGCCSSARRARARAPRRRASRPNTACRTCRPATCCARRWLPIPRWAVRPSRSWMPAGWSRTT